MMLMKNYDISKCNLFYVIISVGTVIYHVIISANETLVTAGSIQDCIAINVFLLVFKSWFFYSRYPNVACELLTCDVQVIVDQMTANDVCFDWVC